MGLPYSSFRVISHSMTWPLAPIGADPDPVERDPHRTRIARADAKESLAASVMPSPSEAMPPDDARDGVPVLLDLEVRIASREPQRTAQTLARPTRRAA